MTAPFKLDLLGMQAARYNFTAEVFHFILSYKIKLRLCRDTENEEE
jgi:hypothetical protein